MTSAQIKGSIKTVFTFKFLYKNNYDENKEIFYSFIRFLNDVESKSDYKIRISRYEEPQGCGDSLLIESPDFLITVNTAEKIAGWIEQNGGKTCLLVDKIISEDPTAKKYSRSQAIAIGRLSRATKQTLVEKAKKARSAQRKRKQEK
jgi:hypothetical protein